MINSKYILTKKEQNSIMGGNWYLINGIWYYYPDDEPENDNESINI